MANVHPISFQRLELRKYNGVPWIGLFWYTGIFDNLQIDEPDAVPEEPMNCGFVKGIPRLVLMC